MPKLVFVDDEKEMLDYVTEYFEINGYQVLIAYDGETGANLILQEKPDLAVVDIRLDGLNGFKVLKKVKENAPEQKMIVWTGYNDHEIEEKAIFAGALKVFHKPMGLEDLLEEIKKFV